MEELALKPISGYNGEIFNYPEKQRNFYPSKAEWAAAGELADIIQVRPYLDTVSSYTVPTGYTFFITSISLSSIMGAVAGNAGVAVRIDTGALLSLSFWNALEAKDIFASYPMPICVNENSILDLSASAKIFSAGACVQGYLQKRGIVLN
jgi:hypothetical protein